ncbi:MAG: hypothetical protein HDT28_00250 [Clostridiales bacterium]|nr:hypothetical protein [Clostridiales bacterium]
MKVSDKFLKFLLKPPIWLCAVVWTIGVVSLGGSLTLYFVGLGGKLWALSVHIVALVFFILSTYGVLTVIGIPAKAKNNVRVRQFFSEYNFRAHVNAAISLIFNLCYVVFGIVIANLEQSVWLGALVGYHVFLMIPRFTVIYLAKIRGRSADEQASPEIAERNRLRRSIQGYTYCGLALILLALAVIPIIRLTLDDQNSYNYFVSAVIYIISAALFTFVKLGIAIFHMKKSRRNGDLSLIAVKNISFSSALISLFTLQAMMLKDLDGGDAGLAARLNPITGVAVVLAILAIGLYMLIGGFKKLKRLPSTDEPDTSEPSIDESTTEQENSQ